MVNPTGAPGAPAAPVILPNGTTTWLNNNNWINGGNITKAARIAKKLTPSSFYKKMQASIPEQALFIDLGSKSPSARLMSYFDIGKKTEVNWGDKDNGGILAAEQGKGPNIQAAEAGFITEIVNESLKKFPERKIEIIATEWARKGYKEAGKVNQTARIAFVEQFAAEKNAELQKLFGDKKIRVVFTIATQEEEANTAQSSLEHITQIFTKLLGKFRGTVKSADGGNGSTQGFGHNVRLGAMHSRQMLTGDYHDNGAVAKCSDNKEVIGVDAAQQYIEEQIAKNFTDLAATDRQTEPVLGGSHGYALSKNPDTCREMGLTATSSKWQTGLNAVSVRDALDRVIIQQKAVFARGYPEKAKAEALINKFGERGEITLKTPAEIAAFSEEDQKLYSDSLAEIEVIASAGNLKGLLITRAVINNYIVKHRTTTIHCGPDGDIKPTHYHGGYVERFVKAFMAVAANVTTLNNRVWRPLACIWRVH